MKSIKKLITRYKKKYFMLEELTKRDFKQKYKGTVLGMGWSVLSPLLTLFVMRMVFLELFGRNTPHYTTYLFCGTLNWSYFKESTKGGMSALMANSKIITKVNIPKYLFLMSKNVSSLINYGLTICVFFVFAMIDHITFGVHFFALLYPVIMLVLFNVGVGMILSALYVFFRDVSYLYDVFTLLLHYLCAIFYTIDRFPARIQKLFLCNPIYCFIKYFRVVTIDGNIPSLAFHLLIAFYTLTVLVIGFTIYKKCNHKFLYYM